MPTALREARHKTGLTVEQVAARAQVAEATVRRAETGRHRPNTATCARLAKVLGVDVQSIFHPDKATESAKAALKTPDPASTSTKKRARGV